MHATQWKRNQRRDLAMSQTLIRCRTALRPLYGYFFSHSGINPLKAMARIGRSEGAKSNQISLSVSLWQGLRDHRHAAKTYRGG